MQFSVDQQNALDAIAALPKGSVLILARQHTVPRTRTGFTTIILNALLGRGQGLYIAPTRRMASEVAKGFAAVVRRTPGAIVNVERSDRVVYHWGDNSTTSLSVDFIVDGAHGGGRPLTLDFVVFDPLHNMSNDFLHTLIAHTNATIVCTMDIKASDPPFENNINVHIMPTDRMQ